MSTEQGVRCGCGVCALLSLALRRSKEALVCFFGPHTGIPPSRYSLFSPPPSSPKHLSVPRSVPRVQLEGAQRGQASAAALRLHTRLHALPRPLLIRQPPDRGAPGACRPPRPLRRLTRPQHRGGGGARERDIGAARRHLRRCAPRQSQHRGARSGNRTQVQVRQASLRPAVVQLLVLLLLLLRFGPVRVGVGFDRP